MQFYTITKLQEYVIESTYFIEREIAKTIIDKKLVLKNLGMSMLAIFVTIFSISNTLNFITEIHRGKEGKKHALAVLLDFMVFLSVNFLVPIGMCILSYMYLIRKASSLISTQNKHKALTLLLCTYPFLLILINITVNFLMKKLPRKTVLRKVLYSVLVYFSISIMSVETFRIGKSYYEGYNSKIRILSPPKSDKIRTIGFFADMVYRGSFLFLAAVVVVHFLNVLPILAVERRSKQRRCQI